MISIGTLTERILIQSEVRTDDGAGGGDLVWNTIANVAAQVTPLRADEKLRAGQVLDARAYRFTIRTPVFAITTHMRLVWDEAPLNMLAVTRHKNKAFTDVVAVAGVGA